ncbi:MAG: hypothetical protein ACLRIL_03005 [Fusicatenibacter saccharivorans]
MRARRTGREGQKSEKKKKARRGSSRRRAPEKKTRRSRNSSTGRSAGKRSRGTGRGMIWTLLPGGSFLADGRPEKRRQKRS